jgi:hypothetical protein
MQQPLPTPHAADVRDLPADQDAYTAFWNCVEDADSQAEATAPSESTQPADAYEQFLANTEAD